MNTKILLISILVLTSCKAIQEGNIAEANRPIVNNSELIEIYQADQSDRKGENIDWHEVSRRDNLRLKRVSELIDSNQVRTSKDYYNAALIFQHGEDSKAYGMAVELMRKSIELDSTANKWLLAAAIDRYLLSKGEPQIYGTQYRKLRGEPYIAREMDTTKISDSERIEFGVPTLVQQREKLRRMNSKKLSELRIEGKSIDEIIQLIETEGIESSDYDISESSINRFGYSIIKEGSAEEALKIFKLNIELYPNRFNTYDSYGECLMLLGQKEKAIEAYKRSLELNPKNTNAKKIIEENK